MRKWNEWHWYVYILKTNDGFYYTGRTWNVAVRFEQHLSGKGSTFTAKHGVRELVYYEEHDDYQAAVKREIVIKDMNRKKKEALIKQFAELLNEKS